VANWQTGVVPWDKAYVRACRALRDLFLLAEDKVITSSKNCGWVMSGVRKIEGGEAGDADDALVMHVVSRRTLSKVCMQA
jgi:hypothetical protein